MPLCARCTHITLSSLLSVEGHLLHQDWTSLQEAALKCELCGLLSTYLQTAVADAYMKKFTQTSEPYRYQTGSLIQSQQSYLPENWQAAFSTPITIRGIPFHNHGVDHSQMQPRKLRQKPTDESTLYVQCGISRTDGDRASDHRSSSPSWPSSSLRASSEEVDVFGSVPIYVHPGDPLETLGIQVREPLAESSREGTVAAKAKDWVRHCSTTHAECRALEPRSRVYPTRLLDLRNVDQTGMLPIIQVSDQFENDYAALSYCWGGKVDWWIDYVKSCQRTAGRDVEVVKMPQTYQDAVTICLGLGYSYLWVDCLCILQGNKEDWLIEGARMCEIYAGAALTISASDSSHCTDGFLTPRSLSQREGVVLPLRNNDGRVGCLHLYLPDTDFPTLVGHGPVAQRAWCLQERQIARRVLHVCQSEVFFECVRCRRFESERIPGDEFDVNDEFLAFHMPRDVHDLGRGKPARDVRNVLSWYSIVQDYTRRGLTFPGDKLIAISGLAKHAQQFFGGEYLAGLWRKQLHIGLAWMIEEADFATRAAAPYRAPSWSWASMDGPVSWHLIDGWVQSDDGFLESAIDLVDSSVDLLGSDPLGPVRYAEITVSGRVKYIPAAELLHNKVLTYPAWMSGASSHLGWYMEDEKGVLDAENIACLKIATRPFGPGPSLPPTNEMIILERVESVENEALDKYRRIGFGQVMVTAYFDDCPMRTVILI